MNRHYASAAPGAKDSRTDKTLPNSESANPQSRAANGRETAIFVITPQLVFRSTNLAGAELLRPGGCFTIRDGLLDVVKIDGDPGDGYGNASPWLPSDRMGRRWRITYLDDTSGHLRLEAHKQF